MLDIMKTIPLTRGYEAIVDDGDYYGLSLINWGVNINDGKCYAKNRSFGKMHRFIMSVDDGLQIDHIDGNGLNNQRSNLRICTPQQNYSNRKKNKIGLSKYKGLNFDLRNTKRPWRALIRVNKKAIYLGCSATEEGAAMLYDMGAKKYFKEFANLNFKDTK